MSGPNIVSLVMVVGVVLLLTLFGALIAVALKGDRLLRRWATDHGYELVAFEQRTGHTGPYFLRHNKLHVVYRVTVMDDGGHRRRGFVRAGGPVLGVLSGGVDVTWDDEH